MQPTRYGRWTVLDPETTYRAHDKVPCRCSCGTEREIRRDALTQGRSTSCGCHKRERLQGKAWPDLAPERTDDITPGARVGRWTVTGEPQPGKNRTVACTCDCGTGRDVVVGHLLTARTKSCGCLRRDGARLHTSGKGQAR